jgi:hypothetical protein
MKKKLFLMGMLAIVAAFGLAAGGAPAGAGVTTAPAATRGYTQATLLAAFNAATSAEQIAALFTKDNFALLGDNGTAASIRGEQGSYWDLWEEGVYRPSRPDVYSAVWNGGANYASASALFDAIKNGINNNAFVG